MSRVTDPKLLKLFGEKLSIKQLDAEKNAPNQHITYVGLARVSTHKQGRNGESIETQCNFIESYCRDRKLKLEYIQKIEETASKVNRTQFKAFLNKIKQTKGKVAIVVTRMDRLTRIENDEINTLREKDKIEIHMTRYGEILSSQSSPDVLLRCGLYTLLGTHEVSRLKERVNEVRDEQLEKGQYLRQALVGYLNSENEITKEKTIIVDPVKAPLVKKVFEEFATGKHTLKSICEYANKLGLKSVYNNVITPGCMSSLLHNKFYCGFFSDKHKTKTFTHDYPKLISMDTFIKIQAILEKKNKKLPKPNPYNSHVFILSNLITCKCGCQMTCYEKRKPNGKTYRYIKCSHESTTNPCDIKQVSENVFLDQIKQEVLSKLHVDSDVLQILKPAIKQDIQQQLEQDRIFLSQLQNKKMNLETKREQYLEAIVIGNITREEYDTIIKKKLDAEEAEIEDQIASVTASQEKVETILKRTINLLSSGLKAFESSNVVEKNRFLKILHSNCVYDGKKLQISVKKPFDLFISKGLNQSWQPHWDSNPDSRLERAVS